ncbi:sarcosine oxidase [Oceanobacillus iheyensis HTE831]|uniref:Sarcosine oxidase n=1 Tax=Oceanobacillus iheyensis (strain DSM 14371 / CIP 107618 / JCM 11309 / KCTC 3954 / HTE831) TaxID=221109 RepID=Q8EMP0_OCEIH|nr:N-methyl-L-tryptophan oxidase [Oceanobacillus iheyensis]BAC14758.1 sarcosine oxidase [Oceanobacillus iheyensis HTE831]
MIYDIAVIGAGSMGLSAGYYLSKAGKTVALIDSNDPPHSEGSHHGETRIIRHAYGEGAAYVPLALRSQELWNDLNQTFNQDIFHQTGVLNIGGDNSVFLQNVIQSVRQYRLQAEILSAKQINSRWHGFRLPDHLMGVYETNSGVLMSEKVLQSYRDLATALGASFYTNAYIHHLDVTNQHITIQLSSDTIKAKQLIITAGKGTNQILSLLGYELPLFPVRKTFSWFKTDESIYHSDAFPAWSFDNGNEKYYGFPSIDNAGIKIGRHDGGHPVKADEALKTFGTYREDKEDVSQFVHRYMSPNIQHSQGKVCTYTNTPDGDFIIDRLPNYQHVLVACGFSGHGFKFSSAVGELLSQLAIRGETSLDISPFSLNRFV